jgi:hypothetical protein
MFPLATKQQRAIFYVVKDANVARLRQAYIATNSDIEAKVIWRTTDPDTYSVHRWMTVLLWFDVVVLTDEILINLLKHPLLDFRVVCPVSFLCPRSRCKLYYIRRD